MSKLTKGILSAVAVSLTLGAAQFALGSDLTGRQQANAAAPDTAVNRAGKADRAARPAGPGVQSQTILLKLDGLAATSVLVRVPVADAARSSSGRSLMKSGNGKTAVACEPMVSVLTEVAKQLQPGRCVT
jgi:hypothetical protein